MKDTDKKTAISKKALAASLGACVICAALAAVFVFAAKSDDESLSKANSSISKSDPNKPFSGISADDIKTVFVYKNWYKSTADDCKYTLSADETDKMLKLLRPIDADPEKSKEMQIYLGGSDLFYIELNDGKEYQGDQRICSQIEEFYRKMSG